nr:hypothetical protein [Tanacetum cinerariifolium]
MKPPHTHFFTSLKQVEKRLKLEEPNEPPSQSSISSPLYLQNHQTNTNTNTNTNSISQPPQEFLSYNHFQTPPNQNNKNPFHHFENNDDIDIGSMKKLLGLCEFETKGQEMNDLTKDEFFDKVVKVKGPKCRKEVERLDGWIKFFLESGSEPLRLTHLLLAKASISSDGEGERVEFPDTVDEFLWNDPPSD